MVKYSVEAIEALLNPIEKVQVRLQFSNLSKLTQKLSDKLCKFDYHIYPDDGYSGYMMDKQAF